MFNRLLFSSINKGRIISKLLLEHIYSDKKNVILSKSMEHILFFTMQHPSLLMQEKLLIELFSGHFFVFMLIKNDTFLIADDATELILLLE